VRSGLPAWRLEQVLIPPPSLLRCPSLFLGREFPGGKPQGLEFIFAQVQLRELRLPRFDIAPPFKIGWGACFG